VPGVGGGHHVLGVEHLCGQLGNADSAVLGATTSSEGSKSGHEEVETREGH
jgi:hypothetical protein